MLFWRCDPAGKDTPFERGLFLSIGKSNNWWAKTPCRFPKLSNSRVGVYWQLAGPDFLGFGESKSGEPIGVLQKNTKYVQIGLRCALV